MPLTRSFKDTVLARVQHDSEFREALLEEAIQTLLDGDLDTGKAVLRDYINATVGFEELSEATGIHNKSLMRMLGPDGNPKAQNLFTVIKQLQELTKLSLRVEAVGT